MGGLSFGDTDQPIPFLNGLRNSGTSRSSAPCERKAPENRHSALGSTTRSGPTRSSVSSESAPSDTCASSCACFVSNASEIYLSGISPRMTCLCSAASMLFRSASAICHSVCS